MAEKIIQMMCPNLTCRRVLAVPESARGRTVKCKGCHCAVRVPTKSSTPGASPSSEAKPDGAPAPAAAKTDAGAPKPGDAKAA